MLRCPKVSVLMPVHNAEGFVAQAVESILGQTFGDFEFIIIDDGSTDGSLTVLRHFEGKDSRVRLISRANTGYVVALNEMLPMARGEFLARMDADDIAAPQRIELQVKYLAGHPQCVVVGCRSRLIDIDGCVIKVLQQPLTHGAIEAAMLSGASFMNHPTVVMRASAVRRADGYRVAFEPAEDLDLFLRLGEQGELANLPEVLLSYRVHTANVSRMRAEQQVNAAARAIAEACARRGLENSRPTVRREPAKPGDCHAEWAKMAAQAGFHSTARKHALKAFAHAPLAYRTWRSIGYTWAPTPFVHAAGNVMRAIRGARRAAPVQ